jgi:hypothetical protein
MPAVDGQGDVYVADRAGGLSSFTSQGELRWQFQTEAGDQAHSGPTIGPDGRIYYTTGTASAGAVQAVSPAGEGLWATPAATPSFFEAPQVSADGRYIILKSDLFAAENGALTALETDLRINRFFPGQDGRDYLLSGNNVIHWRQAGAAIEVLDVAEWDTSHLQVATPVQAGVSPAGVAWMLYTTPGGSSSLAWVSLDDQVLGLAGFRYSGSRLIDMVAGEAGYTGYVCGGAPFEEQNAECGALVPGSHDFLWSMRIRGQGRAQGGFYLDGRLYLSLAGGKLLAIDETANQRASEPASQPGADSADQQEGKSTNEQVGGQSGEVGLVWQHQFAAPLLGAVLPEIQADGSLYGLTEHDGELSLEAVNPDGSLRYRTPLPSGPLQLDRSSPLGLLYPLVLPDGTVLIVSEQESVYALGPDGERAWEQPLKAPPVELAEATEGGEVYLVDGEARLYAFDAQGLRWQFQSQAAPYTASSPVAGPDGKIYYTVTDRSRGFVQAVSADGQGLWAAEAQTSAFYERLQTSPDGQLVFLKEDIFSAESGERLAYESPVPVDEFITGRDGRTYLRSGHSVLQWELGPAGFTILQTANWDHARYGAFPPFVLVDENGILWLMYAEDLVWLDSRGRVLGQFERSFNPGHIDRFDLENTRLVECSQELRSGLLSCAAHAPGAENPAWQAELGGVPTVDFGRAALRDEFLYVLGGQHDDAVYKYFIGGPE